MKTEVQTRTQPLDAQEEQTLQAQLLGWQGLETQLAARRDELQARNSLRTCYYGKGEPT